MIIRPRHISLRLLASVLVLIQIAFCGLGALPHAGERAGNVVSVSAPGSPASAPLHDELRCPICQFTAQHAQPVLACITITCTDVPDAPIAIAAAARADLPPHFTPSWRAPPARLS
jgi:hypothetical protein